MFETVLGVVLGGVITIIVTIVTEHLRRPKLVISPADPLYYPVAGPNWASLRFRVSNKALRGFLRQPAIQSKASITFSPVDGQDAFERAMAGRWASAPEPIPLQIITGGQPAFLIDPTRLEAGSRIDILPGETVELDLAAQFEDGCFGWNNETYFVQPNGRNPNWRLERGRYLLDVVVTSLGQSSRDLFVLVVGDSFRSSKIEPASKEQKRQLGVRTGWEGKLFERVMLIGSTVGAWLAAIAVFAVYCFQVQDAKNIASVEFSTINFHGEIADLRNSYYRLVRTAPEKYAAMVAAVQANKPDDNESQALLDRSAAFIYYLDHAAKLMNENKLNIDYVAPVILCTVWNGADLARQRHRADFLPTESQTP